MRKLVLVGLISAAALSLSACSQEHTESHTPASSSVTIPTVKTSATEGVPVWIHNQSITSAKMGDWGIDGENYHVMVYYKPNDAASDFMYTVTNAKTAKKYSIVVHVKDVAAAITNPKSYATWWYLGDPSQSIMTALQNIIANYNSDWKNAPVTALSTPPTVHIDADSSVQGSHLPVPKWIDGHKGSFGEVPSYQNIENQKYAVMGYFLPNNAASDFMYTLTNISSGQKYSVVVHVKDVDAAINHPKGYATYWYLGKPDKAMIEALQAELNKNPNWV